MVIDSHQHFWNYNPDRHSWISDEMAVLKKNFLPLDLDEELQKNRVDGCVSVQADQSLEETDFLLAAARENKFIKGVVGWVDLLDERIDQTLERYTEEEVLVGLRHIVQDEVDDEFMLRGDFQRGIAQLDQFDLTYDILIFPRHLKVARELVQNFPNQKFVIDHLAKPPIKSGDMDQWKKDLADLSVSENVWCKLSGMVTEADWDQWEFDDFVPYLDHVLECFGSGRVMFGSDWPVCLLAGSYKEVCRVMDRFLNSFTISERMDIMGNNAVAFYNLKNNGS